MRARSRVARLRIVAFTLRVLIVSAGACSAALAQEVAAPPILLGHVAWSSAAAGSRALARVYAGLFEIPPRHLDDRFLLGRMRAEYALLGSGSVAVNRPLGVVFVASESGAIERVEFGVVADPAAAVAPGTLRRGEWCFGTPDEDLASSLVPLADSLVFERDGQRVDLAIRIGATEIAATALPAWRAVGALALRFLADGDPRARWLADGLALAEAVPRELASCEVAARFGVDAVTLTALARPVAGSRFEDHLSRVRAVDAEAFVFPPDFAGGVLRVGLEPERITEWFTLPATTRITPHDDASPPPVELRWRSSEGGRELALIPRPGDAPIVLAAPAGSRTEPWIPLARDPEAGDSAVLQRGDGDLVAFGAVVLRPDDPPCSLRFRRRGDSLVIAGEFPISSLRAALPRLGR